MADGLMALGYMRDENKNPEQALKLFTDKKWVGISPNSVNLASVISACRQADNSKFGRLVHGFGLKLCLEDVNVSIALVRMLMAFFNVSKRLGGKRPVASRQLDKALVEKEKFLVQKSKVKWLSLGDYNDNFFFNQVRDNWNHNKILALENSDGDMVFGHNKVAQVTEALASSLVNPVTQSLILHTLKNLKETRL
ncbi:hypothetical protein AgCh_010024 [Apium graveolens]